MFTESDRYLVPLFQKLLNLATRTKPMPERILYKPEFNTTKLQKAYQGRANDNVTSKFEDLQARPCHVVILRYKITQCRVCWPFTQVPWKTTKHDSSWVVFFALGIFLTRWLLHAYTQGQHPESSRELKCGLSPSSEKKVTASNKTISLWKSILVHLSLHMVLISVRRASQQRLFMLVVIEVTGLCTNLWIIKSDNQAYKEGVQNTHPLVEKLTTNRTN